MESVLLQKDGPIGYLVLNRPDKRNALSLDLMNELLGKLDQVAQDETIRVVVIRGEGQMFSAGHDIKEMSGTRQGLAPVSHDLYHLQSVDAASTLRAPTGDRPGTWHRHRRRLPTGGRL